ncbi:MAG: archease [Saprospiraceae bacterium]|nr:archease [Saprospiraceae bacterium]
MYKIDLLNHTADIRLKVVADSEEELFEGSMTGMSSILKEDLCLKNKDLTLEVYIELGSMNKTILLIDFLSEVLTESYINHAIFCKLSIYELTDSFLKAKVFGLPIDRFDEEIKAVTYHEAEIQVNDSGHWQTNLIFDI